MTTRAPVAGTDTADTAPRRATAVRLVLPAGPPLDPFAVAGDDGIVLADRDRVLVGLGRALELHLPGGLDDAAAVDAVGRALADIVCDDRMAATATGHPVVAFGALPFDRTAPASLVVPELTWCREPDGTEWVTLVDAVDRGLPDADDPVTTPALRASLAERARPHATRPPPSAPVVVPRADDAAFERSVAAAVGAIHRGEVVKVVLARAVDVHLDTDLDVVGLLRRWADLEPSCTVFSLPTPDGQFVGASPELLVDRTGTRVRSRPLAGTTDRIHDARSALPTALLESAKDGEEHRLVVDAIRDQLAPLTSELQVPEQPELVHLHTITHLGTAVDGTLRTGPDGTPPTALHLVARLHPTPAVGGVPRAEATDLIARLEHGPRGTYAGPVGWVDGAGDGRWMVGIRALTVDGADVRMTAGVGIVAGSDPRTELVETGLKLQAVFDALAPGAGLDTAATG